MNTYNMRQMKIKEAVLSIADNSYTGIDNTDLLLATSKEFVKSTLSDVALDYYDILMTEEELDKNIPAIMSFFKNIVYL